MSEYVQRVYQSYHLRQSGHSCNRPRKAQLGAAGKIAALRRLIDAISVLSQTSRSFPAPIFHPQSPGKTGEHRHGFNYTSDIAYNSHYSHVYSWAFLDGRDFGCCRREV